MRSRFLVRFHFRFQDQRWDGVMQNSIQTLNICKLNKTMVLRSLKNKTLKIVFRFANVITGVSEEEYKESYTIQKCQEGKKQRTVSIGSIRLFKHWRTTLHLVLVMTRCLVNFRVPLSFITSREFPATNVTGEWFFASVSAHVGRQMVRAGEGTHTNSALEWLLA